MTDIDINRVACLVYTPDTSSMASIEKEQYHDINDQDEHRLMTINEIINGSVSSILDPLYRCLVYHRMNLLVF
jgi:hypothetical protein